MGDRELAASERTPAAPRTNNPKNIIEAMTTSTDGVFLRGENLVWPAGRAAVTTQFHILVGGVALGYRLSCLTNMDEKI